ncbi:MAG TPA: hypothetical protein VGF48_23710 [Thermoanaerobaculia bacterium]|jgi:hypothetical protein
MKLIALIAVFATACSSGSGLIDQRTMNCGSGQDVDIVAGMQQSGQRGRDFGGDRAVLVVNVANNTHGEVTITNVSADQITDSQTTYVYDRANLNPDATLAEGEEKTFELPMTGRRFENPDLRREEAIRRESQPVILALRVTLSNGDAYVCRYSFQPPL